ncbi:MULTISPECIES: hypothetical protein [Flavobacteriaceae]|uniref:hypothetical protein n=1 Tax=Flavobacteriaceae TaxID=49546 RepID=UPI00234B239C|nr:hypothetical protein [Muricauda sp. SP22]MDC6363515.1 hypothetical protein [Muricauda sp. SP22]
MNARVLSIVITLYLVSCNRDNKVLKINDFSESKTIHLKPYQNYPYSMMNVWVKGYTNDTILIKLNSKSNQPILKLSGQINERWYTDYYGEGEKNIIFEPYKATEGSIEIEAKL